MKKKKNIAYYKVTHCDMCPNYHTERVYTGDSFDLEFVGKCKRRSYKHIGYIEFHKHMPIPNWCPLLKNGG